MDNLIESYCSCSILLWPSFREEKSGRKEEAKKRRIAQGHGRCSPKVEVYGKVVLALYAPRKIRESIIEDAARGNTGNEGNYFRNTSILQTILRHPFFIAEDIGQHGPCNACVQPILPDFADYAVDVVGIEEA